MRPEGFSAHTPHPEPFPSRPLTAAATCTCPHRPERNLLPDAYGDQLAAALRCCPDLVELALHRSALGSRGLALLCQGLRHPDCRLQNLR